MKDVRNIRKTIVGGKTNKSFEVWEHFDNGQVLSLGKFLAPAAVKKENLLKYYEKSIRGKDMVVCRRLLFMGGIKC